MIKKMKGLTRLILLIDSPSFPRRRESLPLFFDRDSRLRGNDRIGVRF